MKKMRLTVAIASCIAANGLFVENVRAEDSKGSLTLALENDLFGAGTDSHYTHGTELDYVSDTYRPDWFLNLASLMPFYETNADTRLAWSLGQQIYTPADITIKTLQPNDRPYAGWLYTSVGLVTDNRAASHYVDELEFVLGLVGPNSGAESVQKTIHKWTGSEQPQGWDNQLGTEVTADLQYQREWTLPITDNTIDIVPRVALTLGSARRDVGAGFSLRLGSGLDSDFGPPLIRPAATGMKYFKPKQSFYWYVFAGAHGRYVEHNIFLDGNNDHDSPSVHKNSWVGEIQAGLVLGWENWRATLTEITRTREFEKQIDPDEYGAIAVSYRY